jgi:HlyD family secretion protein
MTLSVSVETGREEQALVLPLEALQGAREGSVQAQVLVLDGGHATAKSVQVGLRTLQAAQITQGLQAGDTVLLPPAKDGQRVRTQPPAKVR